MDEEERSECSRSCTPESLASTGTANIDPTEYYSDDEDELCLDESLEQTIAVSDTTDPSDIKNNN